MTAYTIALFLHVVGALALFMALALEWTSLARMRRATTAEQVRDWLSVLRPLRWVGPIALVAILLPGLSMAITAWAGAAWTGIALAALLLIAVLGALTGPRMRAIGRAAAQEHGPLSAALQQRLRDPLPWTSVQTRVAIALGVVFLMTVKPEPAGALLAVGVAAILGLASTAPAWSRDRVRNPAA